VTDQGVILLSGLEHDALTELVNLGVGRAAMGLRSMVGSEVRLSVPSVAFISRARAAELVGTSESGKLVAVQ
jgi:chemotaxis protein CheC